MKRIVLDTNIWLSALFWEGSSRRIIDIAEKGNIEILVSREIIIEIVEVLQREAKFQKFLDARKEKIQNLARSILKLSKLVKTNSKIEAVKEDKDDNKFLECAVDGNADFILSYDNHLLNIRKFNDIQIIKPEEFLRNFIHKIIHASESFRA